MDSGRIKRLARVGINPLNQLTPTDRQRIDTAIQRAHEIGFTPEPAGDVARRLRSVRSAAASSAIEKNPLTPLEREMQEQLIRRRVPAEVAIAVMHEDVLAHPLGASNAA